MIVKGMYVTYRNTKKLDPNAKKAIFQALHDPKAGKVEVQKVGTNQKFPADLDRLRPYWLQKSDAVRHKTASHTVTGIMFLPSDRYAVQSNAVGSAFDPFAEAADVTLDNLYRCDYD